MINKQAMIEIFKTNVNSRIDAYLITRSIKASFAVCDVSFDLDDRDKILRIVSDNVLEADDISRLLATHGFHAAPLPDEILTL